MSFIWKQMIASQINNTVNLMLWIYANLWKWEIMRSLSFLPPESTKISPFETLSLCFKMCLYFPEHSPTSLLHVWHINLHRGSRKQSSMFYSPVSICLIPPVFKWLTYGEECENLALLCICLSVRVTACCFPRRPLLGVCHYPAGAALMEAVISNAVN